MKRLSVQKIPGTVLDDTAEGGAFATFLPLLKATDGLTLGQICSITGLEPSTVQNWIKRGFVPHPIRKRYGERQLARILLIAALRSCMKIDEIGELMVLINGDTEDESDDIVSEPQLYDILCESIRRIDRPDDIRQVADAVTAGIPLRDPTAKERLTLALKVMVCAYIAGKFRQQTDFYLHSLKQKGENQYD